MNNHLVTIFESWKLSFQKNILVEIQHSLNGLMTGTILRSQESGLRWRVSSRTLFIQAENQKRFDGETETFQHFSFKAPFEESFNKFQSRIEENERNHIYQYSIEPLGHEGKPRTGEVLEVE
jgi:hypothetical protein